MRKITKNTSDTAAPERTRRDAPIVPGQRLLFKPQVLQLLGLRSYSTLWQWMRDGAFPLPLELGPRHGRSSAIAWDANEVLGWIANRPRRQLGQHEFRGRDPALGPKQKAKRVTRKLKANQSEGAPL